MARYDITYRCGHTDTVQIYGTNVHGERERKAAWYATRLCPDCYRRSKEEYVDSLPTHDDGLPTLEGSPKQVKWAQDIRARKLEEVDDVLAMLARGYVDANPTEEQAESYAGNVRKVFDAFRSETSARYWIDRRNWSGRAMVMDIMRS